MKQLFLFCRNMHSTFYIINALFVHYMLIDNNATTQFCYVTNVSSLVFSSTSLCLVVHKCFKDPVTKLFMILYHKYDAQIKIYQFCKFQKALFIKILSNLTFHVNKGRQ
jgi:hypothetical protein